MKKFILLLLLISNSPAVFSQEANSGFYFFAFGDMPYFYPQDFGRFDNLIQQLNHENPAFSVHIGDIKTSGTPCSDEHFEKIMGYFDKFEHPLIYTPGDNEWTDCNKKEAGSYDPNERLEKLREVFYKDKLFHGKGTLEVATQSDFDGYEKYIENLMWEYGNVTFGTVHVVGSNNNLLPQNKDDKEEYLGRDAANIFWIKEIFDQARTNKSAGVVIFMHAAMVYKSFEGNGFNNTVAALKKQLHNYGLPVLMIYGDAHKFMIDKPMRNEDGSLITNFTALQVFGSADMHAVKITVVPESVNLFHIDQELIKGN